MIVVFLNDSFDKLEMEKLTPEKILAIMKNKGYELTADEAKKILDFLRFASKIIVRKFVEKNK